MIYICTTHDFPESITVVESFMPGHNPAWEVNGEATPLGPGNSIDDNLQWAGWGRLKRCRDGYDTRQIVHNLETVEMLANREDLDRPGPLGREALDECLIVQPLEDLRQWQGDLPLPPLVAGRWAGALENAVRRAVEAARRTGWRACRTALEDAARQLGRAIDQTEDALGL